MKNTGFTIIELVVVLLLISIISAAVFSRFQDGNTFNAYIIRDQIISLARTAQQSSLGRADVTLTISTPASDTVRLTTAAGGNTISEVDLESDGVSISGDINNTASCSAPASVITSSPAFVVNFAELGDLAASGFVGSEAAINSAIRICLNDSVTDSVCISPSGFAYAGDCDV